MKKSLVLMAACAILAFPAAAEITAKKDPVKGSKNLDVIRLDGATLFGSAEDVSRRAARRRSTRWSATIRTW